MTPRGRVHCNDLASQSPAPRFTRGSTTIFRDAARTLQGEPTAPVARIRCSTGEETSRPGGGSPSGHRGALQDAAAESGPEILPTPKGSAPKLAGMPGTIVPVPGVAHLLSVAPSKSTSVRSRWRAVDRRSRRRIATRVSSARVADAVRSDPTSTGEGEPAEAQPDPGPANRIAGALETSAATFLRRQRLLNVGAACLGIENRRPRCASPRPPTRSMAGCRRQSRDSVDFVTRPDPDPEGYQRSRWQR